MSFNYKNLSAGYVGEMSVSATLNSQYYAILFAEDRKLDYIWNDIMPFPQRIPRSGFFYELCVLETNYFKKQFNKTVDTILESYKAISLALVNHPCQENIRRFINWANILLRYGCFDELIHYFPSYQHSQAEMKLIFETAKIEKSLSNEQPVSIDGLLTLSNNHLDEDNVSNHVKIKLLNEIIVYFYRHHDDKMHRATIVNLANILRQLTENFENNHFISMLHCSIAYRGLAMVVDFDNQIRDSFIKRAEFLARKIQHKTELEKIVANDNLFTCLQSVAKWHLYNKEIEKAETFLQELTIIDPYDSTSFSELGFFYISINSYKAAADYFNKAMALGPPGAGMNSYYYAKCLEKIGKRNDAIKFFIQATELDKQAISPWLDILNFHLKNKDKDKVHQVASHIYNDPILMEQLEENETRHIQAILN